MATTIKLKSGSGAPLAGDLVAAEPAFDLTNKRLYTEDSGGTVIEVGTNPSTLTVDGNVGIGTTSPQQMLHLSGSVPEIRYTDTTGNEYRAGNNNGKFRIYDQTAASDRLVIDSSGNVGIGGIPTSPLHVFGDAKLEEASPTLTLSDTSDGSTHLVQSINTALNIQGAGQVRLSTSATERMRIDSSGNVGIGTTSPSYQFTVQSTGNATSAIIAGTTSQSILNLGDTSNGVVGQILYDHTTNSMRLNTAAAERMRIDSSGNVGIGTASPTQPLDISASMASAGSGPVVQVTETSGGARNGIHYTSTATTNSAVDLFKIEDAVGTRFIVKGGGNVGIGTTSVSNPNTYGAVLNIEGYAPALVLSEDTGRDYTIGVNGNNLNIFNETTNVLTIADSGNVGIGTTSPASRLHISPSNNAGDQGDVVFTLGNETNNARGATITKNTSSPYALTITAGLNASAGSALVFNSNPNTETMRIDASGNVGIGTTSPSYPLQIGDGTDATETLVLRSNDTGNCLIFFGDNSDVDAARIVYEHTNNLMYFSVNGNQEAMRIDSSGNLLVGTTSTSAVIGGTVDGQYLGSSGTRYSSDNGTGGKNHNIFYNANGQVGSISTSGSSTTFSTSSDQRLKENIVDAPAGNIDAIRVRSFDWKADGSHQTYGMVAQELVDVAPEAVTQGETEDEMWGVDYSKLVPMMIKEIQDLKAEVAALKGA